MKGDGNGSNQDGEDHCDEGAEEDVYESAEEGDREEDDTYPGPLEAYVLSVGDSGNRGGPMNLSSPSPSPLTFRLLCPYSPSPPSHSTIISPLADSGLPVCTPLPSTSSPCTSPVVPSVRSPSSSPDSASQDRHRGRSRAVEGIVPMGDIGIVVMEEIGTMGWIGAPLLLLLHRRPMVGEIGGTIQEWMGDWRG